MKVDICKIWKKEAERFSGTDVLVNYYTPALIYKKGKDTLQVRYNHDRIDYFLNGVRYDPNKEAPDFVRDIISRIEKEAKVTSYER